MVVDDPGVMRRAARDSVTVAGWTLVSRVSGLLRVVIAGAVMGPTFFGNVFQAAYVLPALVYSAVAGPVLAMVLVPTVVGAVADGGPARARTVVGGIAGQVLAAAVAVAVALAAASPVIAWVLTVGFPDGVDPARAREIATLLVLFVAPQVVLYTVAALGVAVQQAHGRFALAAAAPAVENVGLMATVVTAGVIWGTGLEIGTVPTSMVVWLGVGSTVSVGVHALLQVLGTARCGVLTAPSMRAARDPAVRDATRRLLRSVGVAAWPSVSMFVLLASASTVPGGVIVVQMAFAIYHAASYLSGRAVSTAVLPRLSEAAGRGDREAFARRWRQGLSYVVMASLPLLVLLAVLAAPTAELLAQGELRDPRVIAELAAALLVVAVAQLVGGVHNLGQQALFARLEDRWPRRSSELALVVTLLTAAAAVLFAGEGDRVVTLVLAIPAAETAGALVVLLAVRSAVAPEPIASGRPLAATATAALGMLPVVLAGLWLHARLAPGPVGSAALVAGSGLAAVAVYAAALRFTLRRGVAA